MSTVTGDWVTFPSIGGDIRGYLALPGTAEPCPAIIMGHENLGLTEHRQAVTRRLAGEGFAVLTVDMYSRIGGAPPRDYSSPAGRREEAVLAAPGDPAAPAMLAAPRPLPAL